MGGCLPAWHLRRILSLVLYVFTKELEAAVVLMGCSVDICNFSCRALCAGGQNSLRSSAGVCPLGPLVKAAELECAVTAVQAAFAEEYIIQETQMWMGCLIWLLGWCQVSFILWLWLWDVFPLWMMVKNHPNCLNMAQISAPRIENCLGFP